MLPSPFTLGRIGLSANDTCDRFRIAGILQGGIMRLKKNQGCSIQLRHRPAGEGCGGIGQALRLRRLTQ